MFIVYVFYKWNRVLCWLMRIVYFKICVFCLVKEFCKFCNFCFNLLKFFGFGVGVGWLLVVGCWLGWLKNCWVGCCVFELGLNWWWFIGENFFFGGFGVVGFGVEFEILVFFNCIDLLIVCRKFFFRLIRLFGLVIFIMIEFIWDFVFNIEGLFLVEWVKRLLNFMNLYDL